MRFVILFLLASIAFAQPWSGYLSTDRAIDWSGAGASIAERETQCGSTVDAYSGTAGTIDTAIANCTAGQFVQLGAGTFTLSTGIDFASKSNVTLRGMGPDSTKLVFSAGVSCSGLTTHVCLENASSATNDAPDGSANWTAGYTKGTTVVTLSSVTGLDAGDMLVLDQDNPATDTGEIWACEIVDTCVTEGKGGQGRIGKEQMQIVEVVSIDGTDVTITPGVHMPNIDSGESPGAWWIDAPITGVGIENLSLDYTASTTGTLCNDGPCSGIAFFNATDSWVKNVRSIKANRSHVWLVDAAHITVRDSYFYGTLNAASQSYGIESYGASDNLAQNNIFHEIAASGMNDNTQGSVSSYNYAIDAFYGAAAAWQTPGFSMHSGGSGMVLFEGNVTGKLEADNVHGIGGLYTVFRNRLHGIDPGNSQNTIPVNIYAKHRYLNLLGNVLGTDAQHTGYECVATSTTLPASCSPSGNNSIYVLGMSGNEGTKLGALDNDTLTDTTSYRWGNYDTARDSISWCGDSGSTGWSAVCGSASEVPTGDGYYPQSIPATEDLPDSFYLTARPDSWWGTPWATPAWPPIGPDVTGESGPGNHTADIPAKLAFDNGTVDTDYGATDATEGASCTDGTVTMDLTGQALRAGQVVSITGITPSGYNALAQITATATDTIDYELASCPGAYSSGGTVREAVLEWDADDSYLDISEPAIQQSGSYSITGSVSQ